MTERPLTPLMLDVLRALAATHTGRSMTGNEIGVAVGQGWEVRRGGSDWSGYMGPAQRIIFPLIALERRGLVAFARREDGLTGSARRITDAGVEALRAHDEAQRPS